jgi:hypothetical protein
VTRDAIGTRDSWLFSKAAPQLNSILGGVAFHHDSILGGAALQRCDHVAYFSTALAAEVAL